jgi:hypothetical protein
MFEEKIRCWHFLSADRRLRWGTRKVVEAGKTYSCKFPYRGFSRPTLCEAGMHGSRRIIDALQNAPGPVICEVDIWGDVVEGSDKLCGTHRHVLWLYDATMVLHEFACRVAEEALRRDGVTDKRCWSAIATKRRWMRGETTDAELLVVQDAARDAARAAAGAAVRYAARYAAGYAAWDAARYAAWYVAQDEARDAQNELLEQMIREGRDDQS